MAIYDPNIAFNRPEVKYEETFNLPVIDSSGMSKMLSGIADRADKSFKEITDAYDEYAKNSRDVLGFRLDNPDQVDRLTKVRTQYGVDETALGNITTNDFNNPYKMRDFGKRFNQVVSDYRTKDIIKEQAGADTYRSQVEALRGVDPEMANVAVQQLDAYRQGKIKGTELNIKAYQPIDLVSDIAKEMKSIPESTISEISRDLEDLGLVYEDVKKYKSKELITVALKSRLTDPVFKNNMIARGYFDASTNTLTDKGARFFEELANEHSKISNTIENVRNIPGFDIDGTSSSSSSSSSKSSSSKSKVDLVDRRIFDGNSAADDRGRLFQDYAEKIGLNTFDEDAISKLKEINGTYISSGENNSPEIAVNKGYNQILKYALENAHADWYAIKAIRDFGYEGSEDSFLKTIADGSLDNIDTRIGEYLDKVYRQESGGDVTTTDANGRQTTVPGVEYSADGKTVTIRGLNGRTGEGSEITVDHSKVFNNLKDKAKEAVANWDKGDIKVEGRASEVTTDMAQRFKNIESSGGKSLYSTDPDSSAIGDYHYLWNTHKNSIKSFLKDNGISPVTKDKAKDIFDNVINKSPALSKSSQSEKEWMAAWLSNPDLQKEYLEMDVQQNYDPFIKNTIIPRYGDILSNRSDWYYLYHYFGPGGLDNYLKTGKHMIKNGSEDNTKVAEKTIRLYDAKNGTNVWEELKTYFKNKGTAQKNTTAINPGSSSTEEMIDWSKIGE